MNEEELTERNLAAQVEEMKSVISELEEKAQPFKEQISAIEKQEREAADAYKFQIAKLREQRRGIDDQVFLARSERNKIAREMEEKQRELNRLINERKAKEIEAQRDKDRELLFADLDELILNAQWGELAKAHQVSAGKYILENQNVILADPMGLGKTLSAIITCDMVEALSKDASPEFPFMGETVQQYDGSLKLVNAITHPVGKRIVYICPASLMRNVRKEFQIWASHRNVTFLGGMTRNERDFIFENVLKDRDDFVVIINYEAWRKDTALLERLAALRPDTIILDEAHNVKELKSNAYRGVKKLLYEAQPAYIIPMTGTPILNRPQELFSLLSLVNPKQFYHINDFLYRFCEQDRDTKYWKFQPGGLDRIARSIRKNFLRRTRDQAGIELPPKTITLHELEVDTENYPDQARVREQMRKYATIMVDEKAGKAVTAAAIIAMFTRLRQIETWPAGIKVLDPMGEIAFEVDVYESQKVDYAISKLPDEQGNFTGLIPELIEDERIVLFSQFKAPLYEIANRITAAGYRAVVLDGETSQELREEIANDFDARYTGDREKSKWDVVLCNYKVGGIGLNLTAATQMVILDEEWNPGKRDQAYDRIHRMGQDKPVTIHVIRNQKTIDDWLAGIMEAKEGLVDGFNSTMISVNEFKEFLDNGEL